MGIGLTPWSLEAKGRRCRVPAHACNTGLEATASRYRRKGACSLMQVAGGWRPDVAQEMAWVTLQRKEPSIVPG